MEPKFIALEPPIVSDTIGQIGKIRASGYVACIVSGEVLSRSNDQIL